MHAHTRFFRKHIATLWDSLPSDVMGAKNITGEISPIHGRKVHCELLNAKNTNTASGPGSPCAVTARSRDALEEM